MTRPLHRGRVACELRLSGEASMVLHVRLESASQWSVRPLPAPARRGGRRSAAAAADFPAEFLAPATQIDQILEVEPQAAVRRAALLPSVDLTVEAAAGERALIAVRHPS